MFRDCEIFADGSFAALLISVILALAVRLYPGGRGAALPAPLPGDLGPREGLHVALELHAAPGAGGHLLHRHVDQRPDCGEGKVEIFF